jgi:cytochrome c553
MKKQLLAISISFALTGIADIANAEGNIKAGQNKAGACAGCHGEKGNSMVSNYPKLAEQHETYLTKQLLAFKDGSRKDAMMEPIVMALSEDDINDISAFYANQKISANELPVIDEDDDDEETTAESVDMDALLAKGKDLYQNGDLAREVSACIACHGPYGEGNKPASFPTLKSQHADYLIKTLTDFKSGIRSNNPYNMMHMIATKMTAEEINAVSYYISMIK